ncbi:MAG: glycine hydroxymethyltransferase [Opitutaceae bacterium]|jgi:glycine hydroxymethyltransferase|nr:glycine hydroxymethyltransferase [Opitutaceae bacterium]
MPSKALLAYLDQTPRDKIDAGLIGYIASLSETARVEPALARSIVHELADQRSHLKLIASENYSSLATQLTMGNLLTDKYAEGISGARFYAGCDNVDAVENFAAAQACKLFGVEHAYVQPHSGADANLVAFWAILSARVLAPSLAQLGETNPSKLDAAAWEKIRQACGNQRLLGLDYYSGGHLTHGYRHNVSAQMFEAHSYQVDRASGLLDYDEIEQQALALRPLILLAGYSAYPRKIDFRRLRTIADKAGAVLMVDMAHFAGLVAGGVFQGGFNPIPHAQVVTTTTHKTLRGPRGGAVFCTKEFAEHVDKGCPLILGGPLPHVMAAKGVAFTEALRPEFKHYAQQVVRNAHALAEACKVEGMTVATGGTDNHLLLIDVRPFGLTGRQAEAALRACGITLNRNSLPYDPNGPWYTSGLRLGSPAVTTLGMGTEDMREIANVLALVLANTKAEEIKNGNRSGTLSRAKFVTDAKIKESATDRVRALLTRFPVYPQLDLAFLQRHFC